MDPWGKSGKKKPQLPPSQSTLGSTFRSFVEETPFTFVVGSQKSTVTVHKKPLAHISEALDTMMVAGMKEQDQSVAELPGVELDVFTAVYEFALKGDYWTPPMEGEVPQVSPGKIDEEDAQSLNAFLEQSFGTTDRTKLYRKVKKPCTTADGNGKLMHNAFGTGNNSDGNTTGSSQTKFVTTELRDNIVYINPQFHARVYCFAEEKLCPSLKAYSLSYLYHDLLEFPLDSNSVDVISDLGKFVYSHTLRSSSAGEDQLRLLLVKYITSKSATLCASQEFLDMLDSYAEMGSDLVRMMSRKTCTGQINWM